ncbi:hypothetical protein EI94DRAFT_1809184 [Lactarius quietus]|nr:hypothetical protein EI94DRAFT_1809184 [Lactarius quietus]
MDDEDLPSGDDRAKTDGEDTDKCTGLDMGDDGEVVESKEDLFDFDPSTVHTMFEKEPKHAKWEAGASANELSGLRGGVDDLASSEDEDHKQGKEPQLTKSMKATSQRAANRLAEVPQWPERNDSNQETVQGSGTSLSSEEEQSGQSSKDEHVPIHGHKANRGWPSTCHYVPNGSGRHMVRLSKQPDDLRAIVKVAISKVIGDVVHQDAYRQINGLISYYQHILWRPAKKSLHVMPFAKRFEQDPKFGKTFAPGVRHVATGKVEGYYQLLAGRECVLKVKALLENSSYIYPTKPGMQEKAVIITSKPFSHPAVIAYHEQFKSSLPVTHPKELEILVSMLALAATLVHSALDDYASGVYRKTDFHSDQYEDIYRSHKKFLEHIQQGSLTKYHHLMANLYTQAFVAGTLPRSAVVSDNAIAQLDLDGMDE